VRKDLVIAVLLGFFLAVTLYPKATGVGEYDPWSDINSDGKMRVDDILDVALRFGSDGDPTRNVTVVNWPNSTDVNVWWQEPLGVSDSVISSPYSAKGFGQLHILLAGDLTSGETITLNIFGKLWDPTHTSSWNVLITTIKVTGASKSNFVTIPVPSETFYFIASTDSVSDGKVFLSFYLTWT